MQDGQNLFDAAEAYKEEWGVDECLDSLGQSYIVVGMDNGGNHRMTEYNWQDHPRNGKEEGKPYLEFVVQTLKPFIDERFRTLKERATTFIAGSSMGGFISFYAGLYYLYIFGWIGVLPPSFWRHPGIDKDIRTQLAAGKAMVEQMKKVVAVLKNDPSKTVVEKVVVEGRHSERFWRAELPALIRFQMEGL